MLGLADRAYVDELGGGLLLEGALEGLIDALDPFSLLVPADQLELYERTRQIGNRHSGLTVLKQRGVAYAMAVEPESPAALAGIEPGDVLTRIEGESTRDLPLLRIRALLAAEVGTTIRLESFSGGSPEKKELKLAEYPAPSVTRLTREGVAVIDPGAFGPATAAGVEAELVALETWAGSPGGIGDRLLLDLRGIGGGDEAAAYEVAGLFTSGELGALIERAEALEIFRSDARPRWQGRMVVLVDRSTQGPAELLASILRQRIGAQLVGTLSFGYSGRQRLFELSGGDRLLLTDAFYCGPDREPLRQALVPDVPAGAGPFTADDETDGVLERGLEVLLAAEDVAHLAPPRSTRNAVLGDLG